MYKKLLLRKNLIAEVPGEHIENVYVPFIGDGDIAVELYKSYRIYGADIDPSRVKTALSRLPGQTIIEANCDEWPFPDQQVEFQLADFDSYSEPYTSFREFWSKANKSETMVLFFTDGHQQGITRAGVFIRPDGVKEKLEDINDRRAVVNAYWSKHIKPWFVDFVKPYRLVMDMKYKRGMMLYWGAVITKSETITPAPPNSRGPYKFNKERREAYLQALREGLRPTRAAESVGVSRQIVYAYREAHPEFRREELLAERESLEAVEDALYQAAISGNINAIKMILFNRDPERWSEKQAPNIINAIQATSATSDLSTEPCINNQFRIVFEMVNPQQPRSRDDDQTSG